MAGYAPTSSHDLCDEELESNGSSTCNAATPGYSLSWECAMSDATEQPPVAVNSHQTHTPADPRAEALVRAQAHSEGLRRRH
jgi:hypothetical protein